MKPVYVYKFIALNLNLRKYIFFFNIFETFPKKFNLLGVLLPPISKLLL